ncbi:MAG TPA: hypothetical protein VMT87_08675 [Vicinamibacteria bacterium]|nr:hypothetical protein [Vicinamibacteria bacterium]
MGLAVVVAACQTITEEMPQQSVNPSGPSVAIVVVPIVIPTPAPAATPAPEENPNPTPNPRPTATPAPTGGNRNPVVSVTAGVHSYLHNGRLVGHSSTTFNVGDVAYLNCTPRDAERKPVDNHGPLQAWFISGDANYRVTDTDTFNPDLHCNGPGKVRIACKVDGITSATTTLTINP